MYSFILSAKIKVYSYDECNEATKKLIDAAKLSTQNAYAPYSGFKVGAAVLLKNGKIISGTNQENAAYPSGLCAERTALFYANSTYHDQPVEAIAVAAFHNDAFTNDVCSPCGSCRQVMIEVENRFQHPIRIIMIGQNKIFEVDSVKDLLPFGFGSEALQ